MELLSMAASVHPLFIAWVIACGIAFFVTAVVRHIALKLKIVAKQDARRRHDRVVPLLGGTGFYIAACVAVLLLWALPESHGFARVSDRFTLCFLAAISLIYGVGVIDDWRELKAPPKFFIQLVASLLILFSEDRLPFVFQSLDLPQWLVAGILVLWMIGVTNAVNMIDGLDGLCAGVVGLSAGTLVLMSSGTGGPQDVSIVLAVVIAGACLGFLFHNFNPAKIFLGDSGSTLLGFILAIISVKMEMKRTLFVSLSMPILLLGVPILDVALSIFRRQRKRISWFRGDRSHLHHRLQQIGLSHRSAVLILWCASGYLNLMAYFLITVPIHQSHFIYASVVPTVGFWIMALYFFEQRLSIQNAQFSHLFLKEDSLPGDDRIRLQAYVCEKARNCRESGEQFTIIVLHAQDVLKQIARSRPARVIEYYSRLYRLLKDRLRGSDLIVRASEHRIVAVLPGIDGKEASPGYAVIEDLSQKVRILQESYDVFQTHNFFPEGFKLYVYPRDAAKLRNELGFDPQEDITKDTEKAA